jgi:hypothetical protein
MEEVRGVTRERSGLQSLGFTLGSNANCAFEIENRAPRYRNAITVECTRQRTTAF